MTPKILADRPVVKADAEVSPGEQPAGDAVAVGSDKITAQKTSASSVDAVVGPRAVLAPEADSHQSTRGALVQPTPSAPLAPFAAAIVLGKSISREEVATAGNTPELQAALASLIEAFAARWKVVRRPNETHDDFLARVLTAGRGKPDRAAFATRLDETKQRYEARALSWLLDVALLEADLRAKHVDISATAPLPLERKRDALLAARSELDANNGVPDAAAKLEAWLDEEVSAALMAPYQPVFNQAFAAAKEPLRAELVMQFSDAYAGQDGVLDRDALARALSKPGPLLDLARLMAAAGKSTLTLTDLRTAAREVPQVARLALQLEEEMHAKNPWADALTAVPLTFGPEGVAVTTNTVMQKLLAKELVVEVVRTPRSTSLALAAPENGEPLAADEQAMAAEALQRLGRGVASASEAIERVWKAGTASDLSRVFAAAGMQPYFGDDPQRLCQLAEIQRAFANCVQTSAQAGVSLARIEERLRAFGLPPTSVAAFSEIAAKVHLLADACPPPKVAAFGADADPSGALAFLRGDPKAALNAEQRDTVRWLQQLLVVLDPALDAKLTYGQIDATLIAALESRLASPAQQFDKSFLQRLRLDAALHLPLKRLLVGEIIVKHPAVTSDRKDGGGSDPVRLLAAYLGALGYSIDGTNPGSDPRFYAALESTRDKPVDRLALSTARRNALDAHALSEEQLAEIFTTTLLVSGGKKKSYATQAAEAAERPAILATLTSQTLSAIERPLEPADFGALALHEPIVALKLFIANLRGTTIDSLLEESDGVVATVTVQGRLTARELAALRTLFFGDIAEGAEPPEAYAQWTRVIEAVRRGEVPARGGQAGSDGEWVTIASLSDDLPADSHLGRDVNAVLKHLRQMAENVRASTAPSDRASRAVNAQRAQFAEVATFADPLAKARELFARHAGAPALTPATSFASLSERDCVSLLQLSSDTTLRTNDAAVATLDRIAAQAAAVVDVGKAISEGRLRVGLGSVETTPRDALLEARAAQVLALVMAGAELLQTRERLENEGGAGKLKRAALTVANNLGVMPGFVDPVINNAVQDWLVIALKTEMHGKGRGPDISVPSPLMRRLERKEGRLALLAAPPKDPANRAALAAMTQIDAGFIRYLVDAHADAIGRSQVNTLISGVPDALPGAGDAAASLLSIAEKHTALRRAVETLDASDPPVWTTLNVTLADSAETRTAKLIVQRALANIGATDSRGTSLVAAREAAPLESLAEKVLGPSDAHTPTLLKAFLVQQGMISASDAGDLRSAAMTAKALEQSAVVALKAAAAFASTSPKLAERLQAAAELLYDAGQRGNALEIRAGSAEAKAIKTIALATVGQLGSRGDLGGSVDFAEALGAPNRSWRVRSERGNTLSGAVKDAPKTFAALAAQIGRTTAFDPDSRAGGRLGPLDDTGAWVQKVEFDPGRAVQSAVGSFLLFRYAMHTLIGYDLWVAPLVKTGAVATDYGGATNDEERSAALDGLLPIVTEWASLWANFTAYYSPAGFSQDIYHEVQSGRLDVALGKGIVVAPMMLSSLKLMTSAAGALHERVMYRGKPYRVVAVSTSQALVTGEILDAPTSPLRRGLSRVAQGVGLATDIAVSPDIAVKAPFRALAAAARRVLGTRYVALPVARAGLQATPVSDAQASARQWIVDHPQGNLTIVRERGGRASLVQLKNSDLLELAKEATTGKVSRSLAARLGLLGEDAEVMRQGLGVLVADLPKPTPRATAGVVPTLAQISAQNGFREWTVISDGAEKKVTVRNSTVVELVATAAQDEKAFLRTVEGAGLAEAEARAIIANYSNESVFALKAAQRRGIILDTAWRLKETVKGRFGKSPKNAAPLARRGPDVAPPASAPLPKALAAADLSAEVLRWKERLASKTPLSAEERAAFETFSKSEGNVSTAARGGAVEINLMRLKVAAQTFAADFSELSALGPKGASVRILKGTVTNLKGQMKTPAFYAAGAIAGLQFYSEIKDTLDDESLDTGQKALQGARSALKIGAVTGGSLALFGVVSKVFPVVGRVASGPVGWLSLGGAVAEQGAKAYGKSDQQRPYLEAIALWKAQGLPETSQLKLDPERFETSGFGYDRRNDIETLEDEDFSKHTPRIDHWLMNPHSPLYRRLKQLVPGVDEREPFRSIAKVQRIDPSQVTRFVEPIYDSVHALEGLAAAREKTENAPLKMVAGARNFHFQTWQSGVRSAARDIVQTLAFEDGTQMVGLDEQQFRALLQKNDVFGTLLTVEQRQVLQQRIHSDWDAASRWLWVLNGMAISHEEKQANLLQFIENLAANHLWNSINFDFVPLKNAALKGSSDFGHRQLRTPDPDTGIDDFYTVTHAIL